MVVYWRFFGMIQLKMSMGWHGDAVADEFAGKCPNGLTMELHGSLGKSSINGVYKIMNES